MKHFYCYYENGLKNHYVNETYELKDGEVLFEEHPTEAQLKKAFLGYAAAKVKASAAAQISTLEASVTQRRIREATLGTDNGWLANVDTQISDLRSQL